MTFTFTREIDYHLKLSLEDLKIFYYVVTEGGFLKASKVLNICQAKISRRILHMEHQLDVMLLYRDMRHIALTRAGEVVFQMAQDVLGSSHKAWMLLQKEIKDVEGPIKLFVSHGFADFWLMPLLAEFSEQYPDVDVVLETADNTAPEGIMMGESDVAITTLPSLDRERVHCELLCTYPLYLYGSHQYLKRKGVPQTLQDLDNHDFVAWKEPLPEGFSKEVFNGHLYMGRDANNPRRGKMIIDGDLSAVSAAKNHIGLGLFPAFFVDDRLQQITLKDAPLPAPLNKKYISYLKITKDCARHRALIDFLHEKIRAFPGLNSQSEASA